jgi:hypothetical protein
VTGSRGSALLIARELTRSAVFEVAGPGGARSEPVRVVVVPLVTVSVSGTGSGGGTGQETVTVTASVAFGSPGDVVVLQRRTVSGWYAVREARATRDRTVAGGSHVRLGNGWDPARPGFTRFIRVSACGIS